MSEACGSWELFPAKTLSNALSEVFASVALICVRWGEGGGVVVSVSDLGLKGPGFDPRAVQKSECMFVNIYHY